MKKIIFRFILTAGFLFAALSAMSQERDASLATVAIVSYANNTGSKDYNWIRSSLPDAVNDSMQKFFSFKRSNPGISDFVAGFHLKAGKLPDEKDMSSIASGTVSDIVISGSYRYLPGVNQIEITTVVYHLSRKKITALIVSQVPVNNQMFQAIDYIAAQISGHIQIIAQQDEYERQKLIAEKKIAAGKPEQPRTDGRLVLWKAPVVTAIPYDNWYITVGAGGAICMPPLFETLVAGFDVRFAATSSYRSVFFFGGMASLMFLFPHPQGSNFWSLGILSLDLKAMIGLNFNVRQKVYFQPYLAAGGTFQFLFIENLVPTGGNPPFTSTVTPLFNVEPLATIGFRLPVRIGAADLFVVPFIEWSIWPLHLTFLNYLQVGVGVSF